MTQEYTHQWDELFVLLGSSAKQIEMLTFFEQHIQMPQHLLALRRGVQDKSVDIIDIDERNH